MGLKALRLMAGNIGKTNKVVKPEEFAKAVNAAFTQSKGGMKIGDMLTPYTPEDYSVMKTFLNPDKKSGFAIKETPTGRELVSVFSTEKGRGKNLAQEGVLRGANKLDNYNVNNVLPDLYGGVGFKPVAEYPFDPTQVPAHVSQFTRNLQPSYMEMSLTPDVAKAIQSTRGLTGAELAEYLATGRLPFEKSKMVQNAALTALAGGGALGYLENR
jgi:hypothetical protein